jgi:hypothetical protein
MAAEPDWLAAKRAQVNERLQAAMMAPALIGSGDAANWESYRWSAADLAWLDRWLIRLDAHPSRP